MRKLIVRQAIPSDIPNVLPLVEKTYFFHDRLDSARFGAVPDGVEMYRGWLTRLVSSDDGLFIVAELNERIVGFIIGAMQSDPRIYRVQRIGFLHDLWVEEEHRRQGIARQLVSEAVTRLKALGAEQARLDSAAGNEVARKLFTASGSRPSVIEMLKEV